MKSKPWTNQEVSILRELWGHQPCSMIARHLKRSRNATHLKALACGLARVKYDGPFDYITTRATAKKLCVSHAAIVRWCKRGMPHVRNGKWFMVRMADISRWLRMNTQRIERGGYCPTGKQRLTALAWSLDGRVGAA